MKTEATDEGLVTEIIMERVVERLGEIEATTYNRIYEGVLGGLHDMRRYGFALGKAPRKQPKETGE